MVEHHGEGGEKTQGVERPTSREWKRARREVCVNLGHGLLFACKANGLKQGSRRGRPEGRDAKTHSRALHYGAAYRPMDRRGFILAGGAVASLVFAPPSAGGSARIDASANRQDAIAEYYSRLQSRVGDAGRGRYLPAVEDALMPEHNDFRSAGGLPTLRRHEGLVLAARAHAADLLERQYFEHASPEGFTSVERVALLARSFVGLAGENIVEVSGGPPSSAAELAELWRNSPGHRTNMLRRAYTHVGIGVVRGGSRTISAVAFGESFAELDAPMAWRVGDGSALPTMLKSSGASIRGYALAPVDGGDEEGPYWLGDPPSSPERAGAYALKPYMADSGAKGRFIIIDGPIVEAG